MLHPIRLSLAALLLAAATPAALSQTAPPAPKPAAPAAAPAAAPTATPAPAPAPTAPAAAASAPAVALAPAGAASAPPLAATLDGRVQDVKSDVIKLNRDLLVLEEELLFPANTQVALFVSMDVGKMFELDSVQIKLDDKVVAAYLYTPLEVAALHRGGVQRGLARQPEDRRARARRLLHRQGPARPRLQARRDREVREGHRGQVHRAAHQGLDGQAAARVRRQALAVGTGWRCARHHSFAGR